MYLLFLHVYGIGNALEIRIREIPSGLELLEHAFADLFRVVQLCCTRPELLPAS